MKFKNYKSKWDKEDKDPSKEEFLKRVKKEKNLKGDEITSILDKQLKNQGYLTVRERNYVGYNKSPFDLAAGDEKKLDLYGFESKGDTDTFDRLGDQLREYFFICSGVYLVLHKKKVPTWLPGEVGVLRISEKGDIYEEESSWMREPFEISTNFEWNELLKANGLGKIKDRITDIIKLIIGVRKNILFNRYFANIGSGFNKARKLNKFYPLTDEQKRIIIGFDVPYHFKNFNRELNIFEKRLLLLKTAIDVGQKTLKDGLK